MVEQANGTAPALPLKQAAERLGITPDALRMRLKRGTAKGYKAGGRLHVYIQEHEPHTAEQRSEPAVHPLAPAGGLAPEDPEDLRRSELARLLRENERLNARIDQLLILQEREQLLRQQLGAAVEDNLVQLRERDRLLEQMQPKLDGLLERRGETKVHALQARLDEMQRQFREVLQALAALVELVQRKKR